VKLAKRGRACPPTAGAGRPSTAILMSSVAARDGRADRRRV